MTRFTDAEMQMRMRGCTSNANGRLEGGMMPHGKEILTCSLESVANKRYKLVRRGQDMSSWKPIARRNAASLLQSSCRLVRSIYEQRNLRARNLRLIQPWLVKHGNV